MYLSAHDIHAHFNGKLSLYTIRQYMACGKIRSRKMGNKWLTTQRDLDAYILSCEVSVCALETVEARISAPKQTANIPDFRQKSIKSILAQLH
jgi:hypothetical protein